MSLLDGDTLSEIYGFPADQLGALPSLALQDLQTGTDALGRLFEEKPLTHRPTIHIPGWDEIIHIVPESFLPLEEQDRRRQERAFRIAQSPTPESVRAIGSILTWVDDIQDALVTAAVITRLVSRFYRPAIPLAAILQEAAATTNIFALGANVPALALTGKFRTTRIIPGLLSGNLSMPLRLIRINRLAPNIGESLQIAQTTDSLFGVGLSLGPIVGLAEDLLFGGLAGADVAFQSGIRYKPGDELFLREEDQHRAEANSLTDPIASILRGAKGAAWLLAAPNGPSFSDRADALVLLSLVAELARGFLPESNWEPILLPQLERDRAATAIIRPKTALAIHRLGFDPHARETYPVPGNPARLSPRAQADLLLDLGPASVAKWTQEAPSPAAWLFTQQLASDLGFRFIRAFEGCPCDFKTHAAPIWRAVIDSMELGLRPPAEATKEQTTAYLDAAANLYAGDLDRKIPVRQLPALHAVHFPDLGK